MGPELTVRRYRPTDGTRVRDLHETAMRDVDAYLEDVPDDDLEQITETYVDAGGEFLVGERDGTIVAMGAFRPIDGSEHIATVVPDLADSAVELTRMRVTPDQQRRGYGRRLYAELERRARSQEADEIVLDTMARQTAARGLYESQGFGEVHRERIDGFGDPVDLLVYRKSLGEA
ncbi:GNAT family N-acetyltransferase [Natrinema salaciae]|uniref:Ribosomal protein S18 acetylase RimI n=1 Tax=Natrinema salaciae TaxID=1186196 RepID=A0A1H9BCD8_9EURY|nr:GNAT family N-acetyltransferase [Natrinema salaciae]SEP86381.1 Ribosomal protein S18 acetylase RimI [Natrinema salaciae]